VRSPLVFRKEIGVKGSGICKDKFLPFDRGTQTMDMFGEPSRLGRDHVNGMAVGRWKPLNRSWGEAAARHAVH